MKESWTKWEPAEGLAPNYYISSVLDTDNEGFRVELFEFKNTSKKIRLLFADWVYSYRYVDEILRNNLMSQLTEKYGEGFFNKWTLYRIDNSEYLEWLSKQSNGLADYRSLKHFCLISMDAILDIISNYEPTIEFVEDNK